MNPRDLSQSAPLPYLTIGDDNVEFDFTTYFQEDDMDYMADAASPGSASAVNEVVSTTPLSTSPSSPSALVRHDSSQKPRLERRGHTKSRRGCYNCKRRRIKCQETRPACGHCVKTGLKCEYPVAPTVVHQPHYLVPLFTLQDMRFFQHFLLNCTPASPLGNESIWTHEIPYLSHNYEYLMHAILGLAASDLMRQDPNLLAFAMAHRVKAIKAIKKSLNVPQSKAFEEGNALLATCYALTLQSVCLDDGMVEFMTFCRGAVIVAIQILVKGAKLLFTNFQEKDELLILSPYMENVPLLQRDWIDMATAAVSALQPLCQKQVETEYQSLLMDVANALYTSSFYAYQRLCKHYGWWMQLPHATFQSLIEPANQTCLLLASHWLAMQQIMVPIIKVRKEASAAPQKRDDGIPMDIGMMRWLKYANQQIDVEHQRYNQWPIWVEAHLDMNPGYFGNEI